MKTKKTAAKKPVAKKAAAKKPAAKKAAPAPKKKAAAAPAPKKKATAAPAPAAKAAPAPAAKAAPAPVAKAAPAAPPPKLAPRADFGQPVDGFFKKQPPHIRPITDALRALVEEAAPDATSSIKWGMPFYNIGEGMMCAIGAHKSHVNLILSGPPGTFEDPDNRLAGDGKTGRHLKVSRVDELPREDVQRWLRTAADRARAGL
jgi:hypothetical protein